MWWKYCNHFCFSSTWLGTFSDDLAGFDGLQGGSPAVTRMRVGSGGDRRFAYILVIRPLFGCMHYSITRFQLCDTKGRPGGAIEHSKLADLRDDALSPV